jgi:SAM-dependent methyltransferase
MTGDGEDRRDIVRRGYDAVSERYRGDDDDPAEYRPWTTELLGVLPPGSCVLDVGCGCGIPVARDLTAAGHAVIGVDISDAQIRRARRLVPQGTFVTADIVGYSFGTERFDAVVALYSLIHVPVADQPEVIRAIGDALADGGVLLATLGWEAWTGRDTDWLGGATEMWWSQADHGTYRDWLQAAGLDVTASAYAPEGTTGHALFWARRRPRRPR